jgi:hypothetical protein
MVNSIHADMFEAGTKPQAVSEAKKQAEKPLNRQFLLAEGSEHDSEDSGLNPAFEYESRAKDIGRWRSQSLSFASTGMIVDDADNDGKAEVFLLGEHRITAYVYKQHKLAELDSYEVPNRVKLLNINTLDMDRDGVSEIIVSGIFTDTPRSFIMQIKDKKLKVLHEDIDLFFNVVAMPPDFIPRLVAQKQGRQELFDRTVHEAVKMGDEFELGNSLSLPSEANVFNFTYLPQGDREYKLIVADSKDRLRVYSMTNERQYRTKEDYAASGLGLKMGNVVPGMGESQAAGLPKQFYYIPTRLWPCNLDEDKEYELLVNQSHSLAAQFFPRYRYFPQGAIHCLRWDGLSLNTVWKTRTIQGTVVDYGIGDVNNNGQNELYVCLNTHPGALGTAERKTVVLSYTLNVQDSN